MYKALWGFYDLQLLKDASGGRLNVHQADALKFDITETCSPHVQRREWHEGGCGIKGLRSWQLKKQLMMCEASPTLPNNDKQ